MRVNRFDIFRLFCGTAFVCLFCASLSVQGQEADGDQKLARHLSRILKAHPQGRSGISIVNLEYPGDGFEHDAAMPLKPASVLKIAVSAAALHELGPEHRFETEFLADRAAGASVLTVLYVRGGGDPALTSEELWKIARHLRAIGIERIERVVLDQGRFVSAGTRHGQRAYQTGASALALNHNSIGFEICPAMPGKGAFVTLVPREAEAILKGEIRTVSRGGGSFSVNEENSQYPPLYRLAGEINLADGCSTVYRSVNDPLAYFARVFAAFLSASGIHVSGRIEAGVTAPSARLVYRYQSPPLKRIVQDLNHFSTNFTGEQLLYALGRMEDGRFDHELGISRVEGYLTGLGVPPSEYRIVDGSGLSHDNRLSARAVSRVLAAVLEEESVRPEFEDSLSVAGRSGTLRKRDFGGPEIQFRGKTGTLNGVSALAGYLITAGKKRVALAILINDTSSLDSALALENELVRALYSLY